MQLLCFESSFAASLQSELEGGAESPSLSTLRWKMMEGPTTSVCPELTLQEEGANVTGDSDWQWETARNITQGQQLVRDFVIFHSVVLTSELFNKKNLFIE